MFGFEPKYDDQGQRPMIRVGWGINTEGNREVYLLFPKEIEGIGLPLDQAELLIEKLHWAIKQVKDAKCPTSIHPSNEPSNPSEK